MSWSDYAEIAPCRAEPEHLTLECPPTGNLRGGELLPAIPRLILQRTFHIRSAMEGTAFTIVVDGRQYFVTARHNVTGLTAPDSVIFETASGWRGIGTTAVWHHPHPEVDVSVFCLHDAVGVLEPIKLEETGHSVGQEVWVAGYPYGMTTLGPAPTEPPLPLIKHGVFSGLEAPTSAPYRVLVYDIVSNPGFSGGPVCYFDGKVWGIAAIAQSTMSEPRKVSPVLVPDGVTEDPTVNVYAGFMWGFTIRYAIEAARTMGNGPKI